MDEVLQLQLERADARWMERWLRGPIRMRHEALPVQAGDPAPDVDLVDSDDRPLRLADLWPGGPVHLMFLRHYGCSCLRERAETLGDDAARVREAGGRTVAVGQGEPERTRLMIEQRGLTVPVLCDPGYRAYDAYGIVEGTPAAIVHDFAWTPGDEATGRAWADERRGTDRRLVDNPWILPAEFVIDREGVIRHAHRYQYCEDFPPATVLVGAIMAAA